jgi:hypothetical protein
MKLGILCGLAFGLAVACSVHHKSEDYACTKNTDCDTGRICNDGFCIVSGSIDAAHTDGPKGDAAGPQCPQGCTSCNLTQKTCTINCMTGNCNGAVSCPPGYHCDIQCNTDNSCRNGVNCALAASCTVDCTGKSSCQGVQCGAGPCDIGCIGVQSCRGVHCNNSCKCDVSCTGNSSCASEIFCTSAACDSGSGCTSSTLVCHSCM